MTLYNRKAYLALRLWWAATRVGQLDHYGALYTKYSKVFG